MDKSEIRAYIKAKKREMTEAEIEARSAILCDKFLELQEYEESSVILCYLSYNQEVRTDAIIENALIDGKIVAVPKITGEGKMEFVCIDSLEDIRPGAFGIPEPDTCKLGAGPDRIANENRMLVLMPGLAFDSEGNRVGYGGGYYDRYFAAHPETEFIKVALCYDFQLLEEVPHTDEDYKADIVISA